MPHMSRMSLVAASACFLAATMRVAAEGSAFRGSMVHCSDDVGCASGQTCLVTGAGKGSGLRGGCMKGLNATSCGAFTGVHCPANHDCTMDPPPGREAADVLFWCQPTRGGSPFSPFAALKNEDAVEIHHRKAEGITDNAVKKICDAAQKQFPAFVTCTQEDGTALMELKFGDYFSVFINLYICDANARLNGMSAKVELQIKDAPKVKIFETDGNYKAAAELPNLYFPGVELTGVTLNIESSGGLKDLGVRISLKQCFSIMQKKCVSQLSQINIFNSASFLNAAWLLEKIALCEDEKCLFPKIKHSLQVLDDDCSSTTPVTNNTVCNFRCKDKYASNSNHEEFKCVKGTFVPEVPPTLKCEPKKSS